MSLERLQTLTSQNLLQVKLRFSSSHYPQVKSHLKQPTFLLHPFRTTCLLNSVRIDDAPHRQTDKLWNTNLHLSLS